MKNSKMISLLGNMEMTARLSINERGDDSCLLVRAEYIKSKNQVVLTAAGDVVCESESNCFGYIMVEQFLDFLRGLPDDAAICYSLTMPVLFVVSYVQQPNLVVLEDASVNDLSSELDARFLTAADEQLDELDFFMDLLETGITLQDIKKYLPGKYAYSKRFMEEHGLITEEDEEISEYVFTEEGQSKVDHFIAKCAAKRKEVLDAGLDTADETNLPTIEDILSDVNYGVGVDADGDYYNCWGVTDETDLFLSLQCGTDFIAKSEAVISSDGTVYNPKDYTIEPCPVCGREQVIPIKGVTRCQCGKSLAPCTVCESCSYSHCPYGCNGTDDDLEKTYDHELLPEEIQALLYKKL